MFSSASFRYLFHAIALERVHFVITFHFLLPYVAFSRFRLYLFLLLPSVVYFAYTCVFCGLIIRITSAFHVTRRDRERERAIRMYVVKHPSNDYYPDDDDKDDRNTNGKKQKKKIQLLNSSVVHSSRPPRS